MLSATSCESSSGFLISTMLIFTSPDTILLTDFFNFSISEPFFPMITPGLEV